MSKHCGMGRTVYSTFLKGLGLSLTLCITFFTGSKAFKELDGIITSKFLLKDIPKLSPDKQTSLVEVLHKVDIYFAPKHTHFFYQGMKARYKRCLLNGKRLDIYTLGSFWLTDLPLA